MPRKILISFLGTGPFESKENRTYKTAIYHLGETNLGEYSFVAAALEKYYNIDSTILVGTVHSMWEEVYKWHKENNGKPLDEDVYLEIADGCEKANYLSPLIIPHHKEIEEALGNESKVVLIKYGISEQEVVENVNIILGMDRFLRSGDELIVDVTHSFRSLPIFMMNLLVYLQNVSKKKISITHIHYGMLEMNKELGFAPIIDLKPIMEINDWITGAYSFSQFGNAYMISRLMEGENLSVATLLKDFSDLMNLNHLFAIKTVAQRLSGIQNTNYETTLPSMIINPIIGDFVSKFKLNVNTKDSVFQLKVARWQLDHRKYAQALLTLTEAIVSYVCESNNLNPDVRENREEAKNVLRFRSDSSLSCDIDIKKIYGKILKFRNSTAHAVEIDSNAGKMISTLRNVMGEIEKIIL